MRAVTIGILTLAAFIPDGDKYWMQVLTIIDSVVLGIILATPSVD